jgi:hypothetical protein
MNFVDEAVAERTEEHKAVDSPVVDILVVDSLVVVGNLVVDIPAAGKHLFRKTPVPDNL